LAAPSFQDFWQILRDCHRGRATLDDARSALKRTPWVRAHWMEPLLLKANERRMSAPRSGGGPRRDADTHTAGPILGVRLSWPPLGVPRLQLHIDEPAVATAFSDVATHQLIFAVDGCCVERWTRQHDGTWFGPRQVSCEADMAITPNLRPVLLTISSKEGQRVVHVDLTQHPLGADVLVFDTSDGHLVSDEAPLRTSKEYALVCDPDLLLIGAPTSERRSFVARTAYRLAPGWPATACLALGDLPFWEARTEHSKARETPRVTLEGLHQILLGSESRLILAGLPVSVRSAVLRIGEKRFALDRANGSDCWQTTKPVTVSATLALGLERVRVEAVTDSGRRLYKALVRLDLVGLAQLDTKHDDPARTTWRVAGPDTIDIAGASGYMQVFAGRAGIDDAVLYEGRALRQRGGFSRPIPIARLGLEGWGAPLTLNVRADSSWRDIKLAAAIEDRRQVEGFLYFPSQQRPDPPRIWLRSSVEPDDRHFILAWSFERGTSATVTLRGASITTKDGRVWSVREHLAPHALGLAFEGVCLGSWFNAAAIASAIRASSFDQVTDDRYLTLFAMLRWLKAPVLSEPLRAQVQRAALRRPVDCVRAWLHMDGLPTGLCHHEDRRGTDTVVRELLWDWEPRNPRTLERMLHWLAKLDHDAAVSEGLRGLRSAAAICPRLLKGVSLTSFAPYARTTAQYLLDSHSTDDATLRRRLTALEFRTRPKTQGAVLGDAYDRARAATPEGRRYLAATMLLGDASDSVRSGA
jgi:hypothetical protein